MEEDERNKYIKQIEEYESSLNLSLDEFKKLYTITKMHPTNEEYQSLYQNAISNLSLILSKLFSLSNEIQTKTEKLNKDLFQFDSIIKTEKTKNIELKRKLGIVENKTNASSELIDDYKDIYESRYLRNWSLFLSSIFCIIAIKIVYKKPVV